MRAHADILYYLNESDEVVTVNAAWNTFARENGAPGALAPCVQWRPIWAFIGDGTTAMVCRRLLSRARQGRTVEFSFRCDSPSALRLAKMRIEQLRTGLLEIRVRIVRSSGRRRLPIVSVARSITGDAQCCSWCQRIETAPGKWLQAETALRGAPWASEAHPLQVRHGSCPQCIARMLALANADEPQSVNLPRELWSTADETHSGGIALIAPLRIACRP